MQKHNGIDFSQFANFSELQTFLDTRQEEPGAFEEFERDLKERLHALECDIKATQLARYDIEARVILVDGMEHRLCLEKEPKTYLSTSGPITVMRNLFRPTGGGKSICPLELRAGIVGRLCTPGLARQISYLMGQMTSVETAAAFREFGVEGPSSTTCDRMPKVIGKVWESNRIQWEAGLQEQETVPVEACVMAVSLDGVMVPDKESQREAKAEREKKQKDLGKATGGPAGYREVGCGTVSLYDEDGTRLDTIRYGRAPEYKKKTLTEQLDAEVASILSVRSDLKLVALADGAEENWRYFASPVWKHAIKIVDHGHACQHLKDGLAAYYGKDNIEGRAEYERLKVILKEQKGGVDLVISELLRLERSLRQKHKKKRGQDVRKERKYFENQRKRMEYARYLELGLPIGSGVVEAACKTLATQRLKRSGMSWGNGVQAILTIRSLQQSGRWDRAWQFIAPAFKQIPLIVTMHGDLKVLSEPDYAAAS